MTYNNRSVASSQLSVGLTSQSDRDFGILILSYLLMIWFSRNDVVVWRDRLFAVVASQFDLLGMWAVWTTVPRYPLMSVIARIKIDAYLSFFMYPSFIPYTQASLSVNIWRCVFFNFSGIRTNGSRMPIICGVRMKPPWMQRWGYHQLHWARK